MGDQFRILKTQAEIADSVGISQAAVSKYINGDSVPMPDTAVKLEEATGCCRESWIWPERHWNPYIPFHKNAMNCLKCPFRGKRVLFIVETALQRFKEKPERSTFQDLVHVGRIMHGIDREAVIVFREVVEPDYPVMAASYSDPTEDMPQRLVAWAVKTLKAHHVIVSFPFPLGIPDDNSVEYDQMVNYIASKNIKSILTVHYGRVEFTLFGMHEPIYYGRASVDGTKKFVKELDRMWKENGYR